MSVAWRKAGLAEDLSTAIPHPASQENEGRGNGGIAVAPMLRIPDLEDTAQDGGHRAARILNTKKQGAGAGALLIHFIGFGCVGLEYFLMGAVLTV